MGGDVKKKIGLLCILLLLLAIPAVADEDKKEDKQDQKRAKIDARTDEVLEEVLSASPKAKELFGKSVGYAVFDNTKAALGISGGGGGGQAVDKASGERTYMKMGTVGVGFGIGVKKYQVVMLFEKEPVFRNFVDKGWQGDTQASATAGKAGAEAEASFHNGMAIFVNSKKGLMANADVSGTKYWQSDLNDED